MTETTIRKEIQIALVQMGCKLFRNNVGVLKDIQGRYVEFGLCPGSSDLIGWMPEGDGRFLAVEVKKPHSRTDPTRLKLQIAFLEAVRKDGGVAFIAFSAEDAVINLRCHLK